SITAGTARQEGRAMIEAIEVFRAFEPYRGKAIVAATGTSGRHWSEVSTYPTRDVTLGGAMGQATSAALGLALGLPDEKVVLFDSEGALLMNLGVLATIAGKAPKNFYHFLLDNECYATTGGQPVPNAKNVKYDQLALACGYPRAYSFTSLEEFTGAVGDILGQAGPVLVAMKVVPEIINEAIGRRPRWQTRSRTQVIEDLRKELGIVD